MNIGTVCSALEVLYCWNMWKKSELTQCHLVQLIFREAFAKLW